MQLGREANVFTLPRRLKSDAVEIQEKRFGYFPQVFRWQGQRYQVQSVERCWTKMARSPRLCFRVRCQEGLFDLCQDIHANTWHLVRVRP